MAPHRTERLQEEIRAIVSEAFLYEIEDPRFTRIQITRVVLTRDLGFARIYYDVGGDLQGMAIKQALAAITGLIRRKIAARLNLRLTPKIEFFYDETRKEIEKVERLFKEI